MQLKPNRCLHFRKTHLDEFELVSGVAVSAGKEARLNQLDGWCRWDGKEVGGSPRALWRIQTIQSVVVETRGIRHDGAGGCGVVEDVQHSPGVEVHLKG